MCTQYFKENLYVQVSDFLAHLNWTKTAQFCIWNDRLVWKGADGVSWKEQKSLTGLFSAIAFCLTDSRAI